MISVIGRRTLLSQKGMEVATSGSIRHYRKPRWVPMAKSKMYKNVELRLIPTIEEQELKQLMRNSRLYHKSLWMFQKQIYEQQVVVDQQEAKQISEDVELERIFAKNEEDNAKVKSLRLSKIELEWKEREEFVLNEKRQREMEELMAIERTEKNMNAELERLKSLITEDNLDEAIQKALAIEVDYNFAINKDGQIFRGRKNREAAEGLDVLHEPVKSQSSLTS